MNETPNGFKETTTKDLSKFFKLERTIHDLSAKPVIGIGIAAVFLSVIWLATHTLTVGVENQAFIIAAGVIGGYMALNIGANDVANAMGTSVGSGALTFRRAIILAAIFEFAGAYFVGGHVAQTIRKGIVPLEYFQTTEQPTSADPDKPDEPQPHEAYQNFTP